MKKLILLIVSFLILAHTGYSQNSRGKSNDDERVAIGVANPDNAGDIPRNALNMLSARISKAASLHGMSAENESSLINIKPVISTLGKEVTSTAPPMISLKLEISLQLVDKNEGNSYNEIMYTVKGVGKTEDEAYTQALKRINPRDGKMKGFIRKGKDKVIEYYNTHCDLVLSKANGMISAQKYREAYELLMGVPSVSRECYDKAMLKIDEFGDKISGKSPDPVPEKKPEDDQQNIVDGHTIELLNGLKAEYKQGRLYGEKLILKFTVINSGSEEKNIKIRGGGSKNYLINSKGEEIKMKKTEIANKDHHWGLEYTILPATPVDMRFIFPKQKNVRQLIVNLNGTTYKLNHLPIQN